jgi:hypothetical protein
LYKSLFLVLLLSILLSPSFQAMEDQYCELLDSLSDSDEDEVEDSKSSHPKKLRYSTVANLAKDTVFLKKCVPLQVAHLLNIITEMCKDKGVDPQVLLFRYQEVLDLIQLNPEDVIDAALAVDLFRGAEREDLHALPPMSIRFLVEHGVNVLLAGFYPAAYTPTGTALCVSEQSNLSCNALSNVLNPRDCVGAFMDIVGVTHDGKCSEFRTSRLESLLKRGYEMNGERSFAYRFVLEMCVTSIVISLHSKIRKQLKVIHPALNICGGTPRLPFELSRVLFLNRTPDGTFSVPNFGVPVSVVLAIHPASPYYPSPVSHTARLNCLFYTTHLVCDKATGENFAPSFSDSIVDGCCVGSVKNNFGTNACVCHQCNRYFSCELSLKWHCEIEALGCDYQRDCEQVGCSRSFTSYQRFQAHTKDHEERQVMRDNKVEPKTRWTSEDSDALDRAVAEVGHEGWDAVAGLLVGWTSAQCRSRWYNSAFYFYV